MPKPDNKYNYFPLFYQTLVLIVSITASGHSLAADSTSNQYSNWSLYGHGYNNQRFSPDQQITSDNVSRLKPAWQFKTGIKGSFQASPIVVDGVMYITTPYNNIIALDAVTGKQLWRYNHDLHKSDFCCGPANRGPAVANGKVFSATIDSRLIALDQKTGKKIWDIAIVDKNPGKSEDMKSLLGVKEMDGATQIGHTGYSVSMAPQVFDGKVFVGITGAGYGLHVEMEENGKQKLSVGGFSTTEQGLRGFLVAYDAETGKEIWRWYTIPDQGWEGKWQDVDAGGKSFNRDIAAEKKAFVRYSGTWRYGGASIWSTPAIDPELGLIYFGTGNPSPNMEDTTRPGDNLYSCSLVALDINTGKLKWYYQQVPHDRWGYDVASPPVLFDFHKNGKTIKAVGQASKLGWFYIHDRVTGELLIRSDPFIQQENMYAQPDEAGVRVVPGTLGATSWSPVALNPELNLVYISAIYQPSVFHSIKLEPSAGSPWENYTYFKATNEPDHGSLVAMSTDTGKIVWQHEVANPMVGGALATAGNLVFTGEGNGNFDAFDATTGKLLWQDRSEYGVNAPPVSYVVNGRQFIAVASGGNSIFGYKTGDDILVYSLDKR